MSSSVTIYHNPKCGTSRTALELIRQAEIEPTIIEYLKTPLNAIQIKALIDQMGISIRDLLRTKEAVYAELKLDQSNWTEQELIDCVAQHPVLMNRPIVVTALGAKLCRPADVLKDILPHPNDTLFHT
jgi:arsenate reductase (glutaredoxin)